VCLCRGLCVLVSCVCVLVLVCVCVCFGGCTDILADLTRKDEALYTHNGPHTRSEKLVVLRYYKYQISGTKALQISGLLHMLNRNVKVKDAPERWQDHDRSQALDVVLTYGVSLAVDMLY
jgi:hypothetical protein